MSRNEQELWIEMNDGVRLDASVFVPDEPAPLDGWPGVLCIHGHGDTGAKQTQLAKGLAEQGYLALCLSVRGQGASEGLSFHMGPREIFDLQDVLTWMSQNLPVNSDRIAAIGNSQGGWSAYMVAAHWPRIRTVIAQDIFTDFAEFAVPNGCLGEWFFRKTMRRVVMTSGLPEVTRHWARSGEWHLIQEWMRPRSPILYADRIQSPVLIIHGWGDQGMPPNDALRMYERLDVPTRILLGSGGHAGYENARGLAVRKDKIERWLGHWLKGEDTGIMDEPPVTYARLPDWEHQQVTTFPPQHVRLQQFYLHADRSLAERPPTGSAPHSNVHNRILDEAYDLTTAIRHDMSSVESAVRRTEEVFATGPALEDYEILGIPKFRLHMLTDKRCFQVHGELYVRTLAGERNLVSRGHYGARNAEPGRHTVVEFDGRAISYTVKQGETLELVVTNYNSAYAFPYFEPFRARLYHDRARPSSITLPTVSL